MESEFIEGYGTLKLSEPTTLCDIAKTLGYVCAVTPAVEKVEKLLEKYDSYNGLYDEEGRYKAGCVRIKSSYSTLFTDEKNPPKTKRSWTTNEMEPEFGRGGHTCDQARSTLRYQLWDAHVEYGKVAPELSAQLKAIAEEMDKEGGT
jgi:hypothetical protein